MTRLTKLRHYRCDGCGDTLLVISREEMPGLMSRTLGVLMFPEQPPKWEPTLCPECRRAVEDERPAS